ncbi:hypothetical protein Patl1_20267 [Pistacia atlantica]|uniref:Uncharacterized protein n=1 Tax=Pistacia atlantica TaxID=434234 RepID=A0ACC1BNA5_9ROSI|nr:hypothetical protein Patl1_20267 [Pistacia atlantica]
MLSRVQLNFSLTKLSLPALLKISSEKNTVNRLKKDIKQLNVKLSQLQALLEEKEAQLNRLRNNSESTKDASPRQTQCSTPSSSLHEENVLLSANSQEAFSTAITDLDEIEPGQELATSLPAKVLSRLTGSKSVNDSSSRLTLDAEDAGAVDSIQMYYNIPYSGR